MALPTFTSGRRVRASELTALEPATSVESKDGSVVDGTTTSTSFTNSLTTTGIRGIVFVAGASGAAEVKWMCGARNSTAAQYTLTSFEVRAGTSVGSGTVVQAADEATAAAAMSDSAGQQVQHAGLGLVTGLTPGASYNACITYRVTANTGTFSRRRIMVTNV